MQAAINAATTFLPRDLPSPPVYSKVNPADAPILTLALTSYTLPLSQVEDLAETRFAQKISQLSGVGLVSISGGQRPAVRIQANPTALAAYGMSLGFALGALIPNEVWPYQWLPLLPLVLLVVVRGIERRKVGVFALLVVLLLAGYLVVWAAFGSAAWRARTRVRTAAARRSRRWCSRSIRTRRRSRSA